MSEIESIGCVGRQTLTTTHGLSSKVTNDFHKPILNYRTNHLNYKNIYLLFILFIYLTITSGIYLSLFWSID